MILLTYCRLFCQFYYVFHHLNNEEGGEQDNARYLKTIEKNLSLILHQHEDDNHTDEKENVQDKEEKRIIPRT